jgi:ankyrin repeat protein
VAAAQMGWSWLRRVLALGVPIEATDVDGATALHLAVVNPVNVKALLEAGAAINARDGDGRTALSRALRQQEFEAAQLLLEAGALADGSDAGVPLARVALEAGRLDVISACPEHQADGVRTLLAAGSRVIPGSLTAIVRHVDVNAADGAGDTALHVAPRTSGCADNVIEDPSLGANPRAASVVGGTPLRIAPPVESSASVSVPIEGGGDMAAVTQAGPTPKEVASGRINRVQSLAGNVSDDARGFDVPRGWVTPVARGSGHEGRASGWGSAGRASGASADAAPMAWAPSRWPTSGRLSSAPSAWPAGTNTGWWAMSSPPGWGMAPSAGRP